MKKNESEPLRMNDVEAPYKKSQRKKMGNQNHEVTNTSQDLTNNHDIKVTSQSQGNILPSTKDLKITEVSSESTI